MKNLILALTTASTIFSADFTAILSLTVIDERGKIVSEQSLTNKIAAADAVEVVLSEERITNAPPKIITQTGGTTFVTLGKTLTLTVEATGTGYLNYQWYHEGKALSSRTPNLVISSVTAENAGNYTCRVANKFGGVTSDNMKVTILMP